MTAALIRDRDLARLNRCLEFLAEQTFVESLRRQAVDAIPVVVPSAFTVWNEFNPATGEMETPVISATTVGIAGGSKQLERAMYDARSIFAAHVDEQPITMATSALGMAGHAPSRTSTRRSSSAAPSSTDSSTGRWMSTTRSRSSSLRRPSSSRSPFTADGTTSLPRTGWF